jgi:hypothetical protein
MTRRGITAGLIEDSNGSEHGFWATVFNRRGEVIWHSDTSFPDTVAAFAAAAEKKNEMIAAKNAPTVENPVEAPPTPSKGKK